MASFAVFVRWRSAIAAVMSCPFCPQGKAEKDMMAMAADNSILFFISTGLVNAGHS